MKTYHSIRVVKANNHEEAIEKIQNEEFDTLDPMCDMVVEVSNPTMNHEEKQKLIDDVIDEIKNDIASGDLTALDEMLMMIPVNILKSYLPEKL